MTLRLRGAALLALASLCLVSCAPTQADISVQGAGPARPRPAFVGGTNIAAHAQNFVQGEVGGAAIAFSADLKAARVPLVRCLAYPDDHGKNRDFPLALFDKRVRAILDAGAQPLFIQYIKPGLKYFDVEGKVGTGGTPATNLAFLLQHYRQAPFNLQTQYWEVGNEPDNAVDYKVESPAQYTRAFNAVHEQLVRSGTRETAVLCGPALTFGYRLPWWGPLDSPSAQLMDAFLGDCKDAVDVVTYHTYSNETQAKDPNWRFNILNRPRHLDNKEDPNRTVTPGDAGDDSPTVDVGLASLIARMKTVQFGRPSVGIGVTEHNSGGSAAHTIQQGLWNLALTHFHLQNASPFPTRFSNSFVFDWKAPQESYAHYNAEAARDPSYWALWMRGNLTGTQILPAKTSGQLNEWNNPHLLVTTSRDAGFFYLEVLNRSPQTIEQQISVDGLALAPRAKIHVLSENSTPETAKDQPFAPGSSWNFPPYSATVFKIALQR